MKLPDWLHIRTRRAFRLGIRFLALLAGAIGTFLISIFHQLNWFRRSLIPFVVVLVAAAVEFLFADYLAEQNYPIATEKKLDLLERRLGQVAVQALSEKLSRTIENFQACDKTRISGTIHILVELSPSA